jgi:hypothetical protein
MACESTWYVKCPGEALCDGQVFRGYSAAHSAAGVIAASAAGMNGFLEIPTRNPVLSSLQIALLEQAQKTECGEEYTVR